MTRHLPIAVFGAGLTAATILAAPAAMAQDALCGAFPVGQASYSCTCTPDAAVGSVWGSGPYTADSNVCTAAIHAGVLGFDGGTVVAVAAKGASSYIGSESNGVVSGDWGSYPNSFVFESPVSAAAEGEVEACGLLPDDAEVYQCGCDAIAAAGGFVWGSGPYTGDSDICAAAVHAGRIGPDGGIVMVLRTPGLQSYRGSEFNGIATSDWGSFATSFVFDNNW